MAAMRPSFTLLHGTWAPGAAWTQPGSALAEGLRRRFGADTRIEALGWKGWNRVGARHRGALALAAHLRQLNLAPDQRHFVIAHSHGGNVALYAMRDEQAAARVSGIVTLATPFLLASRRRFSDRLGMAQVALLTPVALALLAVAGRTADALGGGWAGWIAFFAVAGLLIAALVGLVRAWDRFSDGVVEAMRFGTVASERLLILRSPGDEASVVLLTARALLAVGTVVLTLVAQLSGRVEALLVRSRARPVFGWLLGLGVLAAWAALLWLASWASTEGAVRVPSAVGPWLWLAVAGMALWLLMPIALHAFEGELELSLMTWHWLLAVVMLAAAILPSLLMVVYGWQLAVANIAVDVSAEASPPGAWRVTTMPSRHAVGDQAAPAMTHSALYDDPAAIAAIVDWVAGRLQAEAAAGA